MRKDPIEDAYRENKEREEKRIKEWEAIIPQFPPEIQGTMASMHPDDYDGMMLADGFEHCAVGIVRQFTKPPTMCYDFHKVIKTLVDRDGMDYDEAVEHFDFNISGAWVGEQTPTFIYRDFDDIEEPEANKA